MKKNTIINEMLACGVHLGHKKKLLKKHMEKYVIKINKKISIINLEITLEKLNNVIKILKKIKELNQKILIICVEKKTRKMLPMAAKSVNMPYVNKRWLGGSLTNFETLKKSINRMNYIEIILNNKNFKIKKKKRKMYEKKIKKSKSFLDGMKNLKEIPNYIFVINVKKNKNALKEAKKTKVKTIAIVDTDNSTENIDYIIPGNDNSYKSIIFFIKKIIQAIKNE